MYMEYLQEEHDIGNYTEVLSSKEYRTRYANYLQKRYDDERNINWFFKTAWGYCLFRGTSVYYV